MSAQATSDGSYLTKNERGGQLRTGPPEARLIDYAAVGPPFKAKDLELEARTRDAAKNHPRMDEGQATDRRAGQEGDGANPVQWRSVPADNEVAVAPHR